MVVRRIAPGMMNNAGRAKIVVIRGWVVVRDRVRYINSIVIGNKKISLFHFVAGI